ncbi:hypothetical protein IQ243_24690 [Nostocales cyanobacterium LEGE 11386]|nr:hypothetical protein [Nostocales cyanobacterium LEGE 11386]
MSKVVAGKTLKKNYTPISNSLIRDSEIDDSTFRLICWMTSHDEGFEVSFVSIQNSLGYGRDKLRKILKNAETHNFLVRRKIRTTGGLFDFEYHIFKDTEDAIAFRKSLPQEELTSDLFSGGGATRGVKTGGGRTRGGESAPLKEKQYRRKQNKENQNREETPSSTSDLSIHDEIPSFTPQTQPDDPNSPVPQVQHDEAKQLSLSIPTDESEQPTPKYSTSLSNSESLHQTNNPSCGSVVPGSFDNHEQTNIALPAVVDQELSFGDAAKLQKYQQLDADGIKLKKPELRDWAALEIAPYIRTYRKSGFILTGGNDVSGEFAIYVAKQNCRKGQEPTIAFGFNVINKCEADPRNWQKLVAWVREWQHHRHTGQTANVAAAVNHQQQIERIRQAASTKFEL